MITEIQYIQRASGSYFFFFGDKFSHCSAQFLSLFRLLRLSWFFALCLAFTFDTILFFVRFRSILIPISSENNDIWILSESSTVGLSVERNNRIVGMLHHFKTNSFRLCFIHSSSSASACTTLQRHSRKIVRHKDVAPAQFGSAMIIYRCVIMSGSEKKTNQNRSAQNGDGDNSIHYDDSDYKLWIRINHSRAHHTTETTRTTDDFNRQKKNGIERD